MQAITEKAPVFIIGAPRSGTTFLGQIMNRFLDLHLARDGGVFLSFYRLLPRYGELSNDHNLQRLVNDLFSNYFFKRRIINEGLEITADDVIAKLKESKETSYSALVGFILSELARSKGKTRWGSKTPGYALHVDALSSMFSTGKFIHLVRDGRDVVLSMRNGKDLLLEKNYYYAAQRWRNHILGGQRYNLLGADRYLEVRYEDLLQKPVKCFSNILHFIGDSQNNETCIADFSSKLETLIKPGNCDKWKKEMPSDAVQIVERTAGDVLQSLNYKLIFPELIHRRFNSFEKALFFMDNLRWKISSYPVKRAFKFGYHKLLTSSRAMLPRS